MRGWIVIARGWWMLDASLSKYKKQFVETIFGLDRSIVLISGFVIVVYEAAINTFYK